MRLSSVKFAHLDGENRLVLRIELEGPVCGPLLVAARPSVADEAFALVDPRILGAPNVPVESRDALLARIASARVPMLEAARADASTLDKVEDVVKRRTPRLPASVGVGVRVTGAGSRLEPVVSPAGIAIEARRSVEVRIVEDDAHPD
jgi:hypothetical protein